MAVKATKRKPVLLTLSLKSDPRIFCAVRGAMERCAEGLGFPPAEGRAITRAVDEALTNVARHAYQNQIDRPIIVTLQMAESREAGKKQTGLEIVISDRGPKIDRTKLSARPLDEIRPGGLGLHFIHEAMDIVEYQRRGGTNRLRLVKYLVKAENAI